MKARLISIVLMIAMSGVIYALPNPKKVESKKHPNKVVLSSEKTVTPGIALTDSLQYRRDNNLNPGGSDLDFRTKQLEAEIKQLREEVAFFKEYYKKEIRNSVREDKQYLLGTFPELRTDRISEIINRYKPCSDDMEFEPIITLAKITEENQRCYEMGAQLLADEGPDFSPELPDKVCQLLSEIKGPVSEQQAADIQSLKDIAILYPKAIEILKERITSVREGVLDREGASENKDYATSIRTVDLPAYIDSNDMKREYRYIISRIPKLKSVYDKWISSLTKNFLDPKTIEIEDYVLGLKTVQIASDKDNNVNVEESNGALINSENEND